MQQHTQTTPKHTNRLAHETSPYLLQHAHNPVDWYPWGDETFSAARERGVPIFLSIGYSTCYWCHVMEREVFENEALAGLMNELFVNIKVDREERPDVDDLYMSATQMMSGRGGWPMSVFLTPPGTGDDGRGLKPFWCGTYIPPTPQHGMPGFGDVLQRLRDAWDTQRNEVLAQADRVASAVAQAMTQESSADHGENEQDGSRHPLGPELVQAVVNALLQSYDQEHGGFGGAPKFPQPTNLALLLGVDRVTGDDALKPVIHHTLDRMARGGMYDQVGGGFHRYSVDARWLVPHFEKMLYDNGQLVELYADAYEQNPATQDDRTPALYRRIACETCEYVMREMTDETGAFYSAQDAEVDGREGGNYVWTPDEVREAIGDETLSEFAQTLYGLDLGPNFQDRHPPGGETAPPVNVLFLPERLSALTDRLGLAMHDVGEQRLEVNRRLLAARDRRKQPRLDDKVITSWNGMMIAGMAKAGRVFDRADFIDAARSAADAVLEHMTAADESGERVVLLRTMRNGVAKHPGYLEDYAHFIHGLIELHRAAGDDHNGRYLRAAQALKAAATERFGDGRGGYYDTLADQSDLFVRSANTYDGAIPSGHSAMLHNALDFAEITGDKQYLHEAAQGLRRMSGSMRRGAMVHAVHALLRLLTAAPSLIENEPDSDQADARQDPVSVTATPERITLEHQASPVSLEVTLEIAPGLHLNAHDTPEDQLIPTRLMLEDAQGIELDTTYPEPDRVRGQRVYEGRVTLVATLRRTVPADHAARPGRLVLRYQACDESRCLAPRSIDVPVAIST